MMYEINLSIPEEILQLLPVTPEDLRGEVLLAAAMKLYELDRLSSGAAANLAGITKTLFLSKLADYGIDTFRLTDAELTEDLFHA